MKVRTLLRQDGQNLVFLAVSMVVLLGVLALAVDVGHIYAERRHMQNAADAGALAGARELCFGDPALAEVKAIEYATVHNRAQAASVEILGGTVTVTATETADTFFANAFVFTSSGTGIASANVRAVAAAACGPANKACGLWPVGFRTEEWDKLYNNGEGCGDSFYIFTGDNINQQPDCAIYDCDEDDDGISDMVPVDSRAWLDFSDVIDPLYPSCAQTGCGASELACWIASDNPAPVYVPACIPGDNGVKSGVKDEVDSRIGDAVRIPLYDSTGCPGISCPGGTTYHVIKFGCVTVKGWIQDKELPRLDGANPPWKGKVIEGAINCSGCPDYCGSTPGGGCSGGPQVCAVSLLK
jgi:hypothetical protein